METPDTPAHTLPSKQVARLAIDSITADDADPADHTKTTDSASLLVLTSQTMIDLLQVLAPLVDAGVPNQPRVVPALGVADQTQDEQRQVLQDSLNKTCMILHSVRASAYHSKQKVQSNFVNTSASPITPPYLYTAECTNSTVADSALKNVQTFNGEVAEAPQQLQEFLRSIFDLAQTHKITRETTIRVLQRKCTSVARVLVTNEQIQWSFAISFHFESQTDIGLNDGFWGHVQGKGLSEFFLNLTRTASRGHKRKDLKETPNQPAFLMILKVRLIIALMKVFG